MKKWAKYIAAAGIPALIVLLTLQGGDEISDGVGLSLVNRTVSQIKQIQRAEVKNAKIGDEIISMRSATAKITKLGSNKFNAMISTTPQHYLDEETQTYKDIDLTIHGVSVEAKADPKRLFDKYVDAGNYRATWFDDKPHDYTFYKDDCYVKFTALYDTSNTQTITEQNNIGIKQSIILLNENADTTFSWIIDSDAIYTKENGRITFKDSSDNFLFFIPNLIAFDANGDAVIINQSLNNDTLYVTVETLNAEYPITVDPSVQITDAIAVEAYRTAGADFAAKRNDSSASGNTPTSAWVGLAADGDVHRAQGRFLLDTIPANAINHDCSLYVYMATDQSDDNFDVCFIRGDDFGPSVQTSEWNDFPGWETSGAYADTILLAEIKASSAFNVSQYNAMAFLDYGNSLIDSLRTAGTSKYLYWFLLSREDIRFSAPTNRERVSFNMNSGANPPLLGVTYGIPPDAPSDFAISDSSTTSLTYTWTDNSGDEDGFFIKNTADTLTVGSFDTNATTGEVTGLTPATSYQFFVVAYNTVGESSPSGNVTHSTNFAYNYTYHDSTDLSDFKTHKADDVDASYTAVRDNVVFASITTSAVDTLGQIKDGGNNYHVWRLSAEVYDLKGMNEAVAGTLQVTLVTDVSDVDFSLQVFEGEWVEAGDEGTRYYLFDGHNVGLQDFDGTALTDVWNTSSFAAGIIKIPMTTAGLNLLGVRGAAGDSLRIVIVSGQDSSATAPAGGEYIILNADDARIIYSWRRNSTKPTNFNVFGIGTETDSLLAQWTDNSVDEDSFTVSLAADTSFVFSVAANETTARIGGVGTNVQVQWVVKALNIQATAKVSDADSGWTNAANLPIVTFTQPADSIITIIPDTTGTGNPADVLYAFSDSASGLIIFPVAGNDTLGRTLTDAAFQTIAAWGDSFQVYLRYHGQDGDPDSTIIGHIITIQSRTRYNFLN